MSPLANGSLETKKHLLQAATAKLTALGEFLHENMLFIYLCILLAFDLC